VGCELFKREPEIVDGHCVLHPSRELEWTEERNWFFRLSRYENFLREHFERHPEFLEPASRRNEILSLIESGLEDISVTRSRLSWAIPFPEPTSEGEVQGTWVWFDALPNYLTATGFPAPQFADDWPAQLHVIGKDITRLHCVIWPAMLRAAELPLPERVWAHGFVSYGGERFSKSAGVSIALDEAVERHGADAFRYFLLREIPWDADGSFTWERFDDRYTAELANDLGNLVNRTLSMVGRYRQGVVPAAGRSSLDEAADTAVAEYRERMDANRLHDGAATVLSLVSQANSFVEERAPWKLAKDPALAARLDETLSSLVRTLGIVAVLLSPFMPGKMNGLRERLGTETAFPRLESLPGLDAAGWATTPGEILFPRPELAPAG
jgi:methionyl-tRNA synthetase